MRSAWLTVVLCLPAIARFRAGPETARADLSGYATVRYVSAGTGSDDSGDGSRARPWRSVVRALSKLNCTAGRRCAVLVAEGVYRGETVAMRPFADLYGGFEPKRWRRDIFLHATTLDGEDARRVAVGANDARIDGFVITRGRVRGYGAGILCDKVSPVISNNTFVANRTLAPSPWNPKELHEDANDGGAIAAINGAAPIIRSNLLAANATEAGRGAGVACHSRSPARIINNVFVENTAGVNDPGRSSDGGAISIYDHSSAEIRDNVIAGNQALARNDGGGIFAALWSSAVIAGNRIVGNYGTDDGGGIFIGGQKHHYSTPFDPIPPAAEYEVRMSGNIVAGNRSSAAASGAMRIAMQARARLENNIVVENPGGVYVQTSAAALWNNTIDSFLFVNDSKSSRELPGPASLVNNIVRRGIVVKDPIAEQKHNSCGGDPAFAKDGITGTARELSRDTQRHTTTLTAGADHGELAGRVIRVADRWSVVKESRNGAIVVWGSLAGVAAPAAFEVLPTFRLQAGSPCIDKGASTGAPKTDFEGDPRPLGKGADIGADEFNPGGNR
jgi:hypothetical protein